MWNLSVYHLEYMDVYRKLKNSGGKMKLNDAAHMTSIDICSGIPDAFKNKMKIVKSNNEKYLVLVGKHGTVESSQH